MIQVLTGLKLSRKILEETKVPMNPEEIWTYAVSKGYDRDCGISGKTPHRTLGAQIYVDIKNGNKIFYKYSNNPLKFGLVSLCDSYAGNEIVDSVIEVNSYPTFIVKV